MRTISKKAVFILAVIIFTLTMAGCSNNAEIAPPKVDGDIQVMEISGVCTAEVVGDSVLVSVVTDIREDVVFKLSVTDPSGNVLDELQMTKVRDVDPSAEFAIQPEWPDTVYGFLVADPDDNNVPGITSSYGKDFGNITYDGIVYNAGKNYIVFKSDLLTIR